MLAVVIASGPSLTREDCEIARNKADFVITVNTSWRMCPTADAHYSNDHDWWLTYRHEVERLASGMTITGHDQPSGMIRIPADKSAPGFRFDGRAIGWGGNSGFAAINLAQWFGARRILLLGFDCQWSGNTPRWHGAHPAHLQNQKPGFHRWLAYHQVGAEQMRQHGVEVINCSRETAIDAYPQASLQQCFR